MLHTISVNKRIIVAGMVVLLMAACALIMPVDSVVAADATWEEYSGTVYDPATGRAYYPCVLYDPDQFGGHGPAAYYKMWYGGYPGGHFEAVVYSADGISWGSATEMQDITTGGYHAQVVYMPGGYGAVPYFYKIWYWDGPNMDYLIDDMHTADSVDGINWVNDRGITQDATYPLISGPSGTDWKRGTYGPVCVFHNPSAANSGSPFDYSFTMYYDATTGGQEVVGLAYSTDGNEWTRYGDDPVLDHGDPGDWDSAFASYGTVIKESDGNWHFWYSGGQMSPHEGIGYASSSDGINWSKDVGNPLISKNDGVAWRDSRTYTPSVLYSPTKFDGNGGSCLFKMWFTGVTATPSSNYAIGYMSSLDPELGLVKTALPSGEVQPGQEITYTLTVENTGTATAQDTVLTDTVPLHTTYVAGSTALNGATVPDVGGTTPLQSGMDVNSPGEAAGEVAPGEQALVVFKVTVDPDTPGGTDIVNDAAVTCTGDPSGATAQTSNRVRSPEPALSLQKSAVPSGKITRGSVIVYTLRLRNGGDGPTNGATLTDKVPTFTSYVTHTTTLNGVRVGDVGGNSPLTAGMAVNSPGEAAGVIAPGEEAVVTFMVQVGNDLPLGAKVRNTAVGEAKGLAPVEASCSNDSPSQLPSTWYFAEGSTQAGFDEYILLSNMGDSDMTVNITYLTDSGVEKTTTHLLPAHSRQTVYVNAEMPGATGVAAIVQGEDGLICERSMYYLHNGITGGDDVIGANSPSIDLFFAEGYTGSGDNYFEEWILLLNTNSVPSGLTIDYLLASGETVHKEYVVPGRQRFTISVDQEVGEGQEVSARIRSELPIVAERAMYFVYKGVWPGGHNGMAVTGARSDWYLAEGFTGYESSQFDEWILVANENSLPAAVTVTYMFPDGSTRDVAHTAPARGRLTISADSDVGEGQEVSARIHADRPVVVERAMYFDYLDKWEGGHNCLGSSSPTDRLYFAEGYTGNPGSQFETWLLVQNTSSNTKTAVIDYILSSGDIITQELELPPSSRSTIYVNDVLQQESLEFSIRITCKDGSPVLLAERAMYFSYTGSMGGSQGGHDVAGY